MFVPVSVVVAAPSFTSAPAPVIAPLSPSALLPPSVSVALVPRSIALATDRLVVVSSVAAPPTLSAPVPSAAPLPSTRPPAFSVVPPV
ncbi:hypothetical protein BamIOP4010DRAFT_6136 [Burkholderia ambifaria IOP40-10]|uniref:Uncharacterized protein n=1 Tax=Burkholderia ambifaria IOP40-10 TaxID=396596 RepID=B1FQ25_9BURK|nr:hypothetical protein BamIOP4010DRAFT_6136 [Burkholderia ambifaria IOP40-10]